MRRCFFWVALLASLPSWAFKMEAGSFTTNDTFGVTTFTSVNLQQSYDVTPLIFILPTEEGGDSADIRVRNVTTTGFQAAAVEPEGNDGAHVSMTVDYIAIEPGNHLLANGIRIQAGSFNTQSIQRHSSVGGPQAWDSVNFASSLGAQATLLAQIQTMNNEDAGDLANPPAPQGPSRPWLSTAVRNVSASGFEAALERAEAGLGNVTQTEEFGWLAIQSGSHGSFVDSNNNSVELDAFNTGDNIDGWDEGCDSRSFPNINSSQRVAVASQIKRDGNNGGWVRRCAFSSNSIGLTIDEDISNDSERSHTTEDVSVVVFSRAFVFDANVDPELLFSKVLEQVVSDPFNNTTNAKAIPGAVVEYRLTASNQGNGIATDVVVIDPVPAQSSLFVADLGGVGSGPILFVDGSPASGLSFNYSVITPTLDDVEFSNDGASSWNYQPTADADGFDAAVTHFRVNLGGSFVGANGGASPSFDLLFRLRVD